MFILAVLAYMCSHYYFHICFLIICHIGATLQAKLTNDLRFNQPVLKTQYRYKSVNKKSHALDPYWVTGFTDAEGSFSMSIFRSKSSAIGWVILPCFSIGLHVRDLELLNSIQKFFNVGSVVISGNKADFRVKSRSELGVIVNHFTKYPLLTTKALNFM